MLEALIVLGLAFLLFVVLPLMLIGLALKALVWILVLPFRILGALFGIFAGVAGVVLKIAGFGLALLLGLFATAVTVVFLPLLPLLLIALFVWLLVKLLRPRPVPVVSGSA